jgi:hypothetical protein
LLSQSDVVHVALVHCAAPAMTERSANRWAPEPVVRGDVQRLVVAGAQRVELLPRDECDEEHFPGANHLPLKSLSRDVSEHKLDQGRPVTVSSWDARWDISSRAASRLVALGYPDVYN